MTQQRKRKRDFIYPIHLFLKLEALGGIILIFCAALAIALANSSFALQYNAFWKIPIHIEIGHFITARILHFWINQGLMTLFFLFVGLQIKKEIQAGVLASRKKAMLPIIAALGGMLMPLIFYTVINPIGSLGHAGWGIPVATDIAFVMAVLMLLGNRIPLGLKVFLLALAIFDDLGSIVMIALFYSSHIAWAKLAVALLLFLLLLLLNYSKIRELPAYLILGICLWLSLLDSGIPPTLAGVLTAIAIPVWNDQNALTPLQRLESWLHPWVNFLILPLFALANAGLSLHGNWAAAYQSPVTLGILAGLCLGKPLGISLFIWLSTRLKLTDLPAGIRFRQLGALSFFGGISFTMALFVSYLAFNDTPLLLYAKIGIFTASLLSTLMGCLGLKLALKNHNPKKYTLPSS